MTSSLGSKRFLYTLYVSSSPTKKWDVWVRDPIHADSIKKVSFGASGYQDFTQHKDQNRRESYRKRHQHDYIDDITKAGSWSWWVLWGESSDISQSLKTFLSARGIRASQKQQI